ncbi:Hypothetical protein CINCED_3A024679 [Cinara cedri]|uniref:Reverse transcriptase domain n=1 Tax=Cinara cedri TaxID=506608 RepID=A0A5E4MZC6_9HEMI|nr:Hypothetical protein CINCED_3A024679 [Cinara cedri]
MPFRLRCKTFHLLRYLLEIEDDCGLTKYQYGFRKSCSTADALELMSKTVEKYGNRYKENYLYEKEISYRDAEGTRVIMKMEPAQQRCASIACRQRGDNCESGGYYKIEVSNRSCGTEDSPMVEQLTNIGMSLAVD